MTNRLYVLVYYNMIYKWIKMIEDKNICRFGIPLRIDDEETHFYTQKSQSKGEFKRQGKHKNHLNLIQNVEKESDEGEEEMAGISLEQIRGLLDEQFEKQLKPINESIGKLDTKIDSIKNELNADINKLDVKIDKAKEELSIKNDSLNAKIDGFKDQVVQKFEKQISDISEIKGGISALKWIIPVSISVTGVLMAIIFGLSNYLKPAPQVI